MIISTQEELEAIVPSLESAKSVAIDTEFERRTTYYPVLSLVQLNINQEIYLVDVHAKKLDLQPLSRWWADPNSVKIFHAGYQDIAILNHAIKVRASNVFDTQIASQLLGINEQISYEKLVALKLTAKLTKAHQQSNWLRRPLLATQLEYAKADVLYLPELYKQLNSEIIKLSREKWLMPKFNLLANSQLERDLEYSWISMLSSQANELSRIRLKNLFVWREVRAQELNRPPSHLLSNHYLNQISLGLTMPKDLSKDVPRIIREEIEEVLELCSSIQSSFTKEELRRIRVQCLSRLEQSRLFYLKESLRTRAATLNIAPSFLANKDEMREAVVLFTMGEVEKSTILNDWRQEFTRDIINHLGSVRA